MVDMSNVRPVVDGEFNDEEWQNAASKKAASRNRREAQIVARGPRKHPFSDAAVYVDESVPKVKRFFETEDHYRAYTKKHESKGPPDSLPPSGGKQVTIDAAAAKAEADRAVKAAVGTVPKGA